MVTGEAKAMAAPIDIQRAGVDQSEEAFRLLGRFFREEGFDTPPEEMRSSLGAMIAGPASAVFVARRGGAAGGVATVSTSVGIEYGKSAEMDDLYVLPRERGSGVAAALLEAVCNWSSEQGAAVVLVTVTPEGEARHRLVDYYRRQGFVHTGRVILERRLERGRRQGAGGDAGDRSQG